MSRQHPQKTASRQSANDEDKIETENTVGRTRDGRHYVNMRVLVPEPPVKNNDEKDNENTIIPKIRKGPTIPSLDLMESVFSNYGALSGVEVSNHRSELESYAFKKTHIVHSSFIAPLTPRKYGDYNVEESYCENSIANECDDFDSGCIEYPEFTYNDRIDEPVLLGHMFVSDAHGNFRDELQKKLENLNISTNAQATSCSRLSDTHKSSCLLNLDREPARAGDYNLVEADDNPKKLLSRTPNGTKVYYGSLNDIGSIYTIPFSKLFLNKSLLADTSAKPSLSNIFTNYTSSSVADSIPPGPPPSVVDAISTFLLEEINVDFHQSKSAPDNFQIVLDDSVSNNRRATVLASRKILLTMSSLALFALTGLIFLAFYSCSYPTLSETDSTRASDFRGALSATAPIGDIQTNETDETCADQFINNDSNDHGKTIATNSSNCCTSNCCTSNPVMIGSIIAGAIIVGLGAIASGIVGCCCSGEEANLRLELNSPSSDSDKESDDESPDRGPGLDIGDSGIAAAEAGVGEAAGAGVIESRNAFEFNHTRTLIGAATEGDLSAVSEFLDEGADINGFVALFDADVNGFTALHGAARYGSLHIVKELVGRGAEINAKNTDGETALHLATSKGHLQVCKYLIENKANVDETDKYGRTALFFAATSGYSEIVKFLVDHGAEVYCEYYGDSIAFHEVDPEIKKYLLELGQKSGDVSQPGGESAAVEKVATRAEGVREDGTVCSVHEGDESRRGAVAAKIQVVQRGEDTSRTTANNIERRESVGTNDIALACPPAAAVVSPALSPAVSPSTLAPTPSPVAPTPARAASDYARRAASARRYVELGILPAETWSSYRRHLARRESRGMRSRRKWDSGRLGCVVGEVGQEELGFRPWAYGPEIDYYQNLGPEINGNHIL